MKKIIVLLISIFTLPAAHADTTVTITNGEWPPYLSENLPGYGKTTQITTEAFKNSGIAAEYTFFSNWARAFEEAKKGERWAGSIAWTKNDERAAEFLYSDPIMILDDTFFHLRSEVFDWNSVEDLRDYRIGLTRGYYYGAMLDAAEKNGQLSTDYTSKEINNFLKLLRRRVNLVGATTDVGYALIEKNLTATEAEQITHHPKPFRSNAYHLIISRKAKNAAQIIEAFNSGLQKLRSTGRYKEIYNGE